MAEFDEFEVYSSPDEYVGRAYALFAPAKLNLRLKIEGRRDDTYHLLSMLNVLVGLRDEVSFSFRAEGGVALAVEPGPGIEGGDAGLMAVDKNLASLAARRFFERFEVPLGAQLTLKKVIPLGSGLGGGSSDAGVVLRFLVRCFSEYIIQNGIVARELLPQEVNKLATSVGSDVPFFLAADFARVTGIGDVIERYDSRFLAGVRCVIVVPKRSNPTRAVYDAFRKQHPRLDSARDMVGERYGEALRLNTEAEGYEPFPSRTIRASLWRQLITQIENDLEPIVREFSPEIGELLGVLRTIPETVSGLTGSGSAMFVLPKTLDYFDKNGTGMVVQALAGRDVKVIDSQLIGPSLVGASCAGAGAAGI